jgi:FeS assembly SUF system protein
MSSVPPIPQPPSTPPGPPVPEPAPGPIAQGPPDPSLADRVVATLKTVYDPEIPVNIHEMGMIYETRADQNGEVYVKMTLTSPMCPVAGSLPGEVRSKIEKLDGVRAVQVDLVWDPPWDMSMISEAARLQLNLP